MRPSIRCVLPAALCVLVWSTHVAATTYVVDPTGAGDFTTIQAGVDAAANRDTLIIRPGEYVENVVCTGKCLRYVGAGVGLTVVSAATSAPTFDLLDMPSPAGLSIFRDMAIEPHPAGEWAVHWNEYTVRFRRCDIPGNVGGGTYYGGVEMWDCTVLHASVIGGGSVITRSHLGSGVFEGVLNTGPWGGYCSGHILRVADSDVGDVTLWCGSILEGDSSTFGDVYTDGGCEASICEFESITVDSGPLVLQDCVVDGSVQVAAFVGYSGQGPSQLDLAGCLVRGSVSLNIESYAEHDVTEVVATHNTILGDLNCTFQYYVASSHIWPYSVRSNVVLGSTVLGGRHSWHWAIFTHNDFAGGFTTTVGADSLYANMAADPLFCGAASSDFTIQACSPCAGAAHDGGDIGAYGAGCDCASSVVARSWGAIKAIYRQPSN